MNAVIPREVAANVLFYFGSGGYEAGSFTTNLMSAIANADQHNLALLALGFPELVAAMRMALLEPGGIDTLRDIFNGDAVSA